MRMTSEEVICLDLNINFEVETVTVGPSRFRIVLFSVRFIRFFIVIVCSTRSFSFCYVFSYLLWFVFLVLCIVCCRICSNVSAYIYIDEKKTQTFNILIFGQRESLMAFKISRSLFENSGNYSQNISSYVFWADFDFINDGWIQNFNTRVKILVYLSLMTLQENDFR